VSIFQVAFPNLVKTGYKITGPQDPTYNCIAWAANETDRWWWPNPLYYWPSGIPRVESLEAFVRAFGTIGFRVCKDAVLESGFEKTAIYADAKGIPTHAARQLPNDKWTSKLGGLEDIEHTETSGLEESEYGAVAVMMRRQVATTS